MKTTIIEWNGSEIPAVLKDLPPGRYVIEPLDEVLFLTEEEETDILEAMDELDAGKGSSMDKALERIKSGATQQ